MKLNVKYFGLIAEWMGRSEEQIDLWENSIAALRQQLETNCRRLSNITYQVAVNQKIASEELELSENDEVAILPPFAGG
ncbi:MAG: MoaD/ThiS family protein [Flavobacteriales bacterium]|nr:MoaD/ThiS family protein [Flavobacteriales bacterium]MCB9186521.1 MoaD/ThiS family protein [Flavobacteriales bacterium]